MSSFLLKVISWLLLHFLGYGCRIKHIELNGVGPYKLDGISYLLLFVDGVQALSWAVKIGQDGYGLKSLYSN